MTKQPRKPQTVESIVAEAASFGIKSIKYLGYKRDNVWECHAYGHRFKKEWRYLKKWKRCTVCTKTNRRVPVAEVLEEIASRGYELLSEYVNTNTPMKLECPNGHIYNPTYKNFKKFDCDGCRRLNFDQMKIDAVEKYNINIISTEFVTAKHKLTFQCNNPDHPPYDALWSTVKRSGCRSCNYEGQRKSEAEILAKLKSLDWTLEEPLVYEGRMSPIAVACKEGHPFSTNWQKLHVNKGCPTCRMIEYRWSYKEAKEYFAKYDYRLQYDLGLEDEFLHTHIDLLQSICPVGHVYPTTFFNFSHNYSRCATCNPAGISVAEQEIFKIILDLGVEALNRHKIDGVEVDIFIPSLNLAIEYCGLYFHSTGICYSANKTTPEKLPKALRRNKTRHRDKYLHCKENGVRLVTIFSDEWTDQREKIINRLKHFLGLSEKVYARKCEVKYIEKKVAYEFLNKWHLQGSINTRYAFGLYHQEELVGVLTLGAPSRAHTTPGYELKRMAFSKAVIGGSSKLIKRALAKTQEDGRPELISYCDLRWGNGGAYEKSGFVLSHESTPSPFMASRDERIHYQNFTGDNREKKKFYWEIYDCGHQKWICKL